MDVVSASSDLRQLLIDHDKCNRQIAALDAYIHASSQRHVQSYIAGNQAQSLHLTLRLSVGEGVHNMYTQYQQSKWSQVQKKARYIMLALQGRGVDTEEDIETPAQARGTSKTERAARQWSTTACQFYRHG